METVKIALEENNKVEGAAKAIQAMAAAIDKDKKTTANIAKRATAEKTPKPTRDVLRRRKRSEHYASY